MTIDGQQSGGPSTEEVLAMAGRLVEQLATAPETLAPALAGAVGLIRLYDIDLEDDDFRVQIGDSLDLLRHGITGDPDNSNRGDWMMAAAIGHAELGQWGQAIRRGEEAAAWSYEDDAAADFTRIELANLYLDRAGYVMSTQADNPHQASDELHDLPALLAGLADAAATRSTETVLRVNQARAVALRWEDGGADGDLDAALKLLQDNIFLLPRNASHHEDLALFAGVCHQLLARGKEVPRDDAIAALESVIAAEPEPSPDHHWLLAQLLDHRHPGGDVEVEAEVRDRIIASLAVAAPHGDALTWEQYGTALAERGNDNDNMDDHREAIVWLARYLEQQDPAERHAWVPWVDISAAHYALMRADDGVAHADEVVHRVTRALTIGIPDEDIAHTLRRFRLDAVFLDGNRPDLDRFIATHPVKDWLLEAQRLVEEKAADGPLSEEVALLAAMTGIGWYYLAIGAWHHVVTHPAEVPILLDGISRMLHAAEQIDDMPPKCRRLLHVLVELMSNQRKLLAGDDDVDLTAAKAALVDPALANEHSDIVQLVGLISVTLSSGSASLSAFELGERVLANRSGVLTRSAEDARELEGIRLLFTAFRLYRTDVPLAEVRAAVARAEEVLSTLPRTLVIEPLALLCGTLHRAFESLDSPQHPAPQVLTGSWIDPVMASISLVEEIAAASNRADTGALRAILHRLDDVSEPPPVLVSGLSMVENLRASAHLALARLEPWNREVIDNAIELHRDCHTQHQPQEELLAPSRMTLARLLRLRDAPGDREWSRRLGLELLWVATWKVLVQSNGDHALEMARNASTAVDELTAWCLDDDAIDDLVQVVDARRGLVLKAAGTGRTVAEQLRRIGRDDLAERWTASGGRDELLLPDWQGPDEDWGALRRTVLRELASRPDELVDRPSVAEVQNALRRHGSGCLVYLLPANRHHDGLALLVPAHGRARIRMLPGLRVDTVVERYRLAYEERAEKRDADSVRRWCAELGELCSWAWEVAGRELSLVAGQHGGVVLVPVGSSGLVPWHAARRTVDGADRYLVQDATISYAPSARLFCDVVGRDEVVDGRPVLVGNPARDLPVGAVEAVAIRDAFYPGGAFYGGFSGPPLPWRPAEDGLGTPAEVLLAMDGPLPLLHLACHAVADMRRPLNSEVRLARERLSSRQLLGVSPTTTLPLGLVVLSGCTTNVSGVDYDEALSLSATFLAIGARSVVGSLWQVPSGRTTAQLVFLFHHYLRAEGMSAAEALRAAQLWMLAPDREYPATMPEHIRGIPATSGFDHRDVECWAGFTQLGQ
ncbi:CHAT domain-containing protein [Crossiella sp. CA-258035]|uniref:CHAT domain-containing protein n=1 Tax=Crossiella sp. CA-258035 TaxID=2981138 RepID=UPI0024BC291A|nr:CHAT domain-containing protein [Crossiella sp. CA-258035]WHT17562.1 CHAT domain-containing protein [Crossiella sp. CA-258035]